MVPALGSVQYSQISSGYMVGPVGMPFQDYDDTYLFGEHHRSIIPPPMPSVPRSIPSRKKMKRQKKKSGKKRKAKKCIRNKRVFLRSVFVHGSKTPVSCYEMKAARSAAHNYTLFEDPSGNISVVISMKRKFLMDLHILRDDEDIQVSVTSKGELASSIPLPIRESAIQVTQGPMVVLVNITRKTCKVSFVSIDIDVGYGDTDPVVVKDYSGIVAKAIQKAARAKRRRNKSRKKTPKSCLASNVPAERSFFVRGKYLMRYRV